jgi:hypothetical protein
MKSYYTAREAIRKLHLPNSTFHYLARNGEIPKIILPLRKQAVYPKSEIDRLAKERQQMLSEFEISQERFSFVVPDRQDLEQLIEIEQACYPEETIIPAETIVRRLTYNPENIHVLKDDKTGSVLGSITMSPIKEATLKKLIDLEIDETQVPVEDYLPFTAGKLLDCYIVSITTKPSLAEKYYAGKLLVATLNFLTELLDRGVTLRRIYTVATTQEGERLVNNLQFSSLNTKWSGEYEEFRHSYVLDMENISPKHKLARLYIKHKKNLERRKKRRRQAKRAE